MIIVIDALLEYILTKTSLLSLEQITHRFQRKIARPKYRFLMAEMMK
jgi:hypothetical protein